MESKLARKTYLHSDYSAHCWVVQNFEPKIVSMIRKCHNHKTADKPWHREEEPHNNHETQGKQTKQSNLLSLPHPDDCKTRMETGNAQQNIEQPQNPTMGVTTKQQQQNHRLRTDRSQSHWRLKCI